MKEWFVKRKAYFMVLAIGFILLHLFVVPAYVRTDFERRETEETNSAFIILVDSTKKLASVGENWRAALSHGGDFLAAIKAFSIVYGVLGCILIALTKVENEYVNIEHGSAGWSENGEEYQVLSKKDGFILADKHYLPVIPDPPNAKNGNILVIGGSGSGKSASFAIPNALQLLGSYIFTDPKGELYDRTAGFFKKNGYEIHVVNLADPRFSDGYNPLSHIRGTTDVDIIAKIISKKDDKGGGNKGDPFWDQTSEALLKAMIYYILLNRPKEEHSLASCLSLVRLGGENEGEDLMNLFMDLPHDNPARRAFETIRLGSEKTFSNILVSLAAKLEAFDSEEIVALTSTNTIEFEELAKKKSVVYFITPESHSTYDFLMNIFFSQLFQRLYEFGDQNGGFLPVPMFLVLDEFANIGRIPNFERVISTCRSKRLHISIILQSLDQLMEIYDEKVTETILANCSTHLFLGSNAPKTLETMSKQLGEKTISRDNVSTNKDRSNEVSGYGYSDQIMARPLMTPDELRRMDNKECIILVQGMRPIRAKKYWYFSMHPRRQEAKEAEISHLTFGNQKRGEYVVTNPYQVIKKGQEREIPNLDLWMGEKPKKEKEDVPVENIQTGNTKTEDAHKENTPFGNLQAENREDDYDLQAELEKRFDELFGGPKRRVQEYND